MTPQQLEKLSPQEKNIKIAEFCGWVWMKRLESQGAWLFPEDLKPHKTGPHNVDWLGEVSGVFKPLGNQEAYKWGFGTREKPDYLNNLNDMKWAQKFLSTPDLQSNYCSNLARLIAFKKGIELVGGQIPNVSTFALLDATAELKADAFLLTVLPELDKNPLDFKDLADRNIDKLNRLHEQTQTRGALQTHIVKGWLENSEGNNFNWIGLNRNLTKYEATDLLNYYYQNPKCDYPLK